MSDYERAQAMTDEEKRFERKEEARLDDMYDAQFETKEKE